jgi:hypothetical protein
VRRRTVGVAKPAFPFVVASVAAAAPALALGQGAAGAGGVNTTTGTVWAWGDDEDGELGNGTHNYVSAVPFEVPGVHGAVAVAGGYTDAYVIVGAPS